MTTAPRTLAHADHVGDRLKPIHDLLAALEADEYARFKFGSMIKVTRKAIAKADENTAFPVTAAIAKTEALLAFMMEAAGQPATKSTRGPRATKTGGAAAATAMAAGIGADGKAG